MVPRLWFASCAPALDPRWAEAQTSLFSASEQARLARIGRAQRRAQFVAGHVLAQQLLQFVLGRAVAVEVAGDGRPMLIDAEPWTLSLSHSGSWVAALLAEGAAGVDIELDRPLRDAAALRTWLEEVKRDPPNEVQGERPNAATTKFAAAHETADVTLRQWTLAEARIKAGVAAPAIYARWGATSSGNVRRRIADQTAIERESESFWLAVAGVANPPNSCIADLAARSYNDCSITWRRVAD